MMPCSATPVPPALPALFAAGNYVAVARDGDPDDWRTYAALGLVGCTERALAGLDRFGDAEARFHAGVARFIAGDEAGAIRIFDRLDDHPHARRLRALLREPQIRVLAQVPWVREGAQDYLGPAARDGRFALTNVSFDPRDRRNAPYADVWQFADRAAPPHFYFAAMVEFHLLPPNLRALGCPILGQISDYDLHVQVLQSWLSLFDELVISDQEEWFDVQGLAPARVATFPRCVGVPTGLPPAPAGARDADVIFSGTVLHPYNWEKSVHVRQLFGVPGIKFAVVNGHLWYPKYLEALGRAKMSFTHQRRPGCVTTRALEALGMGCGMLVQTGNVLGLYLSEADGLFECDIEGGALPGAMQRVLADWPARRDGAARWSATARRAFAMERVALEYLRFLCFLATRPAPTHAAPTSAPEQRRAILWKGPMQLAEPVVDQLRTQNLKRWLPRREADVTALIDLVREIVLCAADTRATEWKPPGHEVAFEEGFTMACEGIARFPRSLVLRFDAIRGALHCGRPLEVSAGLEIATMTLAEPAHVWEIDPRENVMPFDFAPGFFNYRRYLDLVVRAHKTGRTDTAAMVALILASLEHYVGWYTGDVARLERAVALDPTFAHYRYTLAQHLVKADPVHLARGCALLEELAEGSVVFPEALEHLGILARLGRYAPANPTRFGQLVELARSVKEREDQQLGLLRPAIVSPRCS
jgi:hypothetical protein